MINHCPFLVLSRNVFAPLVVRQFVMELSVDAIVVRNFISNSFHAILIWEITKCQFAIVREIVQKGVQFAKKGRVAMANVKLALWMFI